VRKYFFITLMMAVCIALSSCTISTSGLSGTGTPTSGSSTGSGSPAGGTPQFGTQAKTSGCQVNGKYPDLACTPGAVFTNVTKDDVCKSGYSSGVRDVPISEKDQVYAEYGIAHHTTGQYEVDHFVSLEIGGSNDISNLWPEAANPTPGFHQKDKVENYLHSQVCDGSMSLHDAQVKIATDWYAVYTQMGGQ
jgi:hypothetical protein